MQVLIHCCTLTKYFVYNLPSLSVLRFFVTNIPTEDIAYQSLTHQCLMFQVAVFVGGVDTTATETKGTVLIHNAEQVTHMNTRDI